MVFIFFELYGLQGNSKHGLFTRIKIQPSQTNRVIKNFQACWKVLVKRKSEIKRRTCDEKSIKGQDSQNFKGHY